MEKQHEEGVGAPRTTFATGRFRIDRINTVKTICTRGNCVPLAIPELDESEGDCGDSEITQITPEVDHPTPSTASSQPGPQQCSEPAGTTGTSILKQRAVSSSSRKVVFISNKNSPQSEKMQEPVRKLSKVVMRRRSSVFLPEIDEQEDYNCQSTQAYTKSFVNYTHDALPRMDNYRNLLSIQAAVRPSLDDLHDEDRQLNRKSQAQDNSENAPGASKFGWIQGVLVRCLLNIWGVMLFLRLSWMVAQAGIIQSMIIIAISTVVTTITTLSMAAVSTNGEMKGGGIYYMISRSLGPEWGGAIGFVFSFANAGMAALNTVGFSESLISLLSENGLKIVDGGQNDNRIISVIAILVLQGIIVVGKEYEAKAQVGLLIILLVAMADFVLGAFVGPLDDSLIGKGYVGLNTATFTSNLDGGYRYQADNGDQNFFTVFSIFFPAVAGIQAGASISGDLKDPATAIPKGTLLAIFLTSASYAFFALLAGAGTVRDATGNITDLVNGTFPDCVNSTCKWGLYNDYNVMGLMSLFAPLIYAGCFAATLSSALSCLVSGSEMFQALGKDKVYPKMSIFGKGYGKAQDPYFSYAAGFVVALIFILIADLNAIAPLISNFFMVTYALLNFCTFHASLLKPLGWRPTFKYYNTWVSCIGAILCVAVMFLMSWVTALISFGCVIALYVIVLYRKPDVNWGSTTQAQTYMDALNALQALTHQTQHVKNYRPQILALTGYPSSRPTLVDFGHLFTRKNSVLICCNISRTRQPARLRRATLENGYDWLQSRRKRAFFVMTDSVDMDQGAKSLIQSAGLGKLVPNIILMGYKTDWQICDRERVKEYFNILHEALDNYVAIAILRVKDGLDVSHIIGNDLADIAEEPGLKRNSSTASFQDGYDNHMNYDPTDPDAMERGEKKESTAPMSPTIAKKKGHKLSFGKKLKKEKDGDLSGVYRGVDGSEVPPDILHNLSLFSCKQPAGTIDVWWLYDDGGLTLLLPYIMTTRKTWASCKLRVFALSNKKSEIELEHRGMASLLSKFRIDYSDLTVIPDITKKAENKTKAFFDSLIKDFKGDPEECAEWTNYCQLTFEELHRLSSVHLGSLIPIRYVFTTMLEKECKDRPNELVDWFILLNFRPALSRLEDTNNPETIITDSELLALREKTNRHLRLRELLLEHSSKSNFVVMTLPVPRKGTVSAPLYLAWLECLTRDMPPFMLVRGNQTSVLTFYS